MAAEVISQNDWFNWSLNQLSREFGVARETVQRRLRDANVSPAGERRGFPVFKVSESARAILLHGLSEGSSQNDPNKMTPKERSDWYKSENERLKYEQTEKYLTAVHESREQMAVIAKTGLQVLETLPDILERDFHLDTEIIVGVEARIDGLRDQWADLLEFCE